MLTLALLRHAKSSWDDPTQDDFRRPLNARGIAAAPRIGHWMQAHAIHPDAVLCSTAVRTRATLALVLPELDDPAPPVRFADELYLVAAPELLDAVRAVAGTPQTLLVVGHNPGIHLLANALVARGRHEQQSALRHRMPTAGLAIIRFDVDLWRNVTPGSGELVDFVSPRHLT